MKIHEYQAKEILAQYGVAVPRGEMANTLEEANAVARKLLAEGASGVVVKAQAAPFLPVGVAQRKFEMRAPRPGARRPLP